MGAVSDGSDVARDVDDLLAMLRAAHAWDDLEGLSILDHGLQTAAILRREHPDDVELQVAGLVHDLGWMQRGADGCWTPDPRAAHDRDGAARLGPLLGARVARLVGGHVAAKRYLVATDTAYRATLSPRSLETLAFQGESMGPDEIAGFERDPDCAALVALRRADEQAKEIGLATDALEQWRPAVERVVAGVSG
jgi:predicted HD phosphohydrolase